MVLFTIVIPAVLVLGFIINYLSSKMQLRPVKVRARK